MDAAYEAFCSIVGAVDGFIWGWPLIIMLLGTHLFTTIRTKFIQRKIGTAIKLSVTKDDPYKSEGDVSQFGALTTALAATIGTGNIVGVATGLILGGPGAIFWMWITGVLGMATKYAETLISVKYRVKDSAGQMIGGAMYALERGFKNKGLGKFLAVMFALFAAVASFGIGASVQTNSLTGVLESNSLIVSAIGENAIPTWGIGIVLVILTAIVIFGGIRSVANVTEKLVPFMAVFYALCCIIICCMNFQFLGDALILIITCAFTGQAAFGGAVGYAIMLALQFGFKRGLFSNESGMGSAPLVAAQAITKNPARQALVSMTGTFWDTVVICLLTGLTLVSTLYANADLQAMYVNAQTGIANGLSLSDIVNTFGSAAALTSACFDKVPVFGPLVLAVGMICFSYSTILGWSQYGNRAITYLFGRKALTPYYIIFLIFVFWGCVGGFEVVWDLSDITNGLMALPNCIAIIGLGTVIAKETQHYVYDGNLEEQSTDEIPQVADK